MSTWLIHPLRGGIHPPECKTLSNQAPITTAPLAKQLIVPLLQHLGSTTEACVKVGDYVRKGQLIADSNNLISAAVHAPSSGVVSFIGPQPYPHASGQLLDAIVIDTDGLETWCELEPAANFQDLAPDELLNKIRQAGISGLGGAGFPTVVKLSPKGNQPIRTLIINGTECEPYITADDVLMREKAAQLMVGIDILVHILQPENVLIAIEDNKPEALASVRNALQGRNHHVVAIPTVYPSGGERQLIQILTGKEVPSAQLPAQLGILCQNVGTVVAVHDAVIEGKPLISRITTLTGQALHKPMNVECLIGTPVNDLLEFAGLQQAQLSRLIVGGPMMGFTLTSLAAPVIKTTNCLLAASAEELPAPPPAMPCIRCGDCAEVCPANLLPQQLHFYALGDDHEQLQAHNLFDCIECGACAYVCPSSIPLVQYYRAAKADIREQAQKLTKAEHAKERFEFRQERLRLEEERKEAERKARAERLARTKAERAKKEAQAQATNSASDNQADAAKDELKRLKIAASMAQVALRKAEKQLAEHGTDELKARVEQLRVTAEQAKQALQIATAAAPSPESNKTAEDELKRLKIAASMAQVALRKTEKQLAEHGTDELKVQVEQLRVTAEQAKQALAAATSDAPAPAKAAANKATKAEPSAAEQALKKAKIEVAMKRAALRKAERNEADAETLTALQTELTQAEQGLAKLNQTEEAGV
ncbi:MAG TPA: electron transport complex subunit RsxC [Gammaproteobacteria bacterium]|nr:electron transport complex subunit RsxC [Gammaproteobacteria bacterium]